jgi:hypothetical protein
MDDPLLSISGLYRAEYLLRFSVLLRNTAQFQVIGTSWKNALPSCSASNSKAGRRMRQANVSYSLLFVQRILKRYVAPKRHYNLATVISLSSSL